MNILIGNNRKNLTSWFNIFEYMRDYVTFTYCSHARPLRIHHFKVDTHNEHIYGKLSYQGFTKL